MNIYVGNLSYNVTENDLKDIFSNYGDVVNVSLIKDRDSGQSKGFGFVEMGSPSSAQAAIQALNGSEVKGRTLTVNEARPREPRESRSFGGGGGGFGGGGRRNSY
jgi:RNA recognition motif-containing protein